MVYKSAILVAAAGLLTVACGGENTETPKVAETDTACVATEDGKISVESAWVRAADASRPTTAAYFTLCNGGDSEDALIGAAVAGVATVELHETIEQEDGMAGMTPVSAIALPTGSPVALEHGGTHVMLIGLEEDLSPGSTVNMTLQFENAEPLEITAEVKDGMAHSGH